MFELVDAEKAHFPIQVLCEFSTCLGAASTRGRRLHRHSSFVGEPRLLPLRSTVDPQTACTHRSADVCSRELT